MKAKTAAQFIAENAARLDAEWAAKYPDGRFFCTRAGNAPNKPKWGNYGKLLARPTGWRQKIVAHNDGSYSWISKHGYHTIWGAPKFFDDEAAMQKHAVENNNTRKLNDFLGVYALWKARKGVTK